MTEDEMIGWHHQLYGHEFEHSPRVGDGQGNLAHCSPWGCKELDMIEWIRNIGLQLSCHFFSFDIREKMTSQNELRYVLSFIFWKSL